MSIKTDTILNSIFILISTGLFIFGSTAGNNYLTIPLSIANTLLFFGIKLIQSKRIEMPKSFVTYAVFLVTLVVHTLIFQGQIMYFLTFLSGGLYWFIIYNSRQYISKYFHYFLIFLGLVMAGFYIKATVAGINYLLPQNLFLPLSPYVRHNHLGDLWALILVLVIYYATYVKRSTWQLPLTLIGLILLIISLSRSAVLSLVVGAGYVLKNQLGQKKSKHVYYLFSALLLLLFLYFGFYKTVIFSRPYFWEATVSLITSPLGIGVGNFYKISPESSLTHNIVLEIVSGMGILSLVFVFWIVKVFKSFTLNRTNVLYKALFLALFINFSFDTTYAIPTMIWLWFSFLGLMSD